LLGGSPEADRCTITFWKQCLSSSAARFPAQVAAPAPLANWGDAWTSQRGIAKHHNTMQFLTTLYLYVRESGAEFQDLVVPSIVAAIKPLL